MATELSAINEACCEPPLADAEVRQIASSVARYPPGPIAPERPTSGSPRSDWPTPLSEAAFHGVAGELVRLISPHSEADEAALLFQLLTFVGNVTGRYAHFRAEQDAHFLNLFTVIVGETSKARKGSSLSQIRYVFRGIDQQWTEHGVTGGLSTGEGLIREVRDGAPRSGKEAHDDLGVSDKRLLVCEPELARVLQTMERDTNTLSAVLREAFDSGNLRTMTKSSSMRATGAHISLIAHVTEQELHRLLSHTAISNGFANRFLWVSARRSRCLPDGGRIKSVDFTQALDGLHRAVEFGTRLSELVRGDRASALWHDVYGRLSEGRLGQLGA